MAVRPEGANHLWRKDPPRELSIDRIKFDEADQHHRRFLQLASEIIARAYEGAKSCFPKMADQEVIEEFEKVDRRVGLKGALGLAAVAQAMNGP